MGRIIVVLVAVVFIGLGAWAVADGRGMGGLVGVVPGGPGS